MTKPETFTLKDARNSSKLGGRTFRASDFLSGEEKAELRRNNAIGKKSRRIYGKVDAFIAELIARFGYDTYKAWNSGELGEAQIAKMLAAERAREKSQLLELEAIIISMVGACVRREKGQPQPKGPKTAVKVYKQVAKMARGELNG